MIKYLILLALIGCSPDIKYGDQVVVTDGFYEGLVGRVTNTYSFLSKHCFVEFEQGDSKYFSCEDLRKVNE